jgi:hypothetical protein
VPVKRDTVVIPEWVSDDDGFEYSDVLNELGIGGSAVDMVEVLQVRWNADVQARLEAELQRLGLRAWGTTALGPIFRGESESAVPEGIARLVCRCANGSHLLRGPRWSVAGVAPRGRCSKEAR